MKIVWAAIYITVGNSPFSPWPLRMSMPGFCSTGHLCLILPEFLIHSHWLCLPLAVHACHTRGGWAFPFDIPSRESCGESFWWRISSHKMTNHPRAWTSYVPVYKSLVVATPGGCPGSCVLRSHPLFTCRTWLLPASPSHLFPNSSSFLGSLSPPSVFFLEIVGNCSFLQSS